VRTGFWFTSISRRHWAKMRRGEDPGKHFHSHRMLTMLRFYWVVAKGYRLTPWKSPYLRWRFETFLGSEARGMDVGKFFRLAWKHRNQMERFLAWADERRRAQSRHR
jgi:hypothetical protein